MGVFVFSIIESMIDTRVKYIVYTSFIGLIGVWACGLTYFFEFRNQKSQENDLNNLTNRTHITQSGRMATDMMNRSGIKDDRVNDSLHHNRRTIIIELPDLDEEMPQKVNQSQRQREIPGLGSEEKYKKMFEEEEVVTTP